MLRTLLLPALSSLLLALGAVADTAAQTPAPPTSETSRLGGYANREEIPGHYSVGIYADDQGSSQKISLPAGEQLVDCFIGISGDSTRTFSALVFRLELPLGVTLDRPITWVPVPGLKQEDSVLGEGAKVEFNKECIVQESDQPAIVGRMRLRVAADVEDFEVLPLAHNDFGLSVELCDDARLWPKPYAEARPLTVTRKRGFFERIRALFGG